MNTNRVEQYPLIPLRDIVVFPGITKPIVVGRMRSYHALDVANSTDKTLFLTLQKDPKASEPQADDLYPIGVVVQIRQMSKLPDDTVKTLVSGLYIAKAVSIEEQNGCLYAKVVKNPDTPLTEAEDHVYRQILEKTLDEYAKTSNKISQELLGTILQTGDLGLLVYTVADSLTTRIDNLQSIIEKDTLSERIDSVVELMHTELEIIRLDEKIKQRVKHQMSKSNREYHLNEQMKAIQKEMGKDDDFKADLDEIEQKLTELNLPESVREKAERELRKMKIMPPMSAESTVVRNYLDWFVSLPWGVVTEDNLDVNNAEEILNRDHFGLEKPKERILEYLAVRKLSQNLKGPIICFVGPPGVGKTSLARSIAESMGRNFVRVSMGGVRDEAEVRGHRKTYIGSMPGKLIQYVRKAGSENPVFLLDEIDKMGSDYRGDPAAALLEALDPEQNKHFVDHYMEVEFDLSKIFFVTTANTIESIPIPLLDRMEIIKISGYTEQEKYHIAHKYLIPKQLKEHSLGDERVHIEDSAVYEVIRYYTKEAGVRNLEREVAALIRKAARKLTKENPPESITITGDDIEGYLGNRVYRTHAVYDDKEIGVATGLAWTPYGGDLLQIEVSMSEGSGKLMVTGQLGEVMQESAKTAFSVVKNRAKRFNVPAYRFKDYDLHLHVPEGAVPKDGPSAGITMTSAIMSAIADTECNCRVAMTGEITLRGKVLPVGGIKEKVLAAHRAGLREIIMPKENEKDLTDIPDDVRKEIQFHFVTNIDEVFDLDILNKSGVMSVGS
ncbi:MAG: endopeptidase La [Deferribacteraceae bacterium]|jgi:ATP-dependent Lon protease|nr:endopeptidase La [Deferribacteraceae bacterium]